MASPSLVISRVVVEGDLSMDLGFDRGLNILQAIPTGADPKSTHKTGKTGLVELIQHGLGKSQESRAKFHFAPISDEIRTLWLEVEANGETFTVERSLQELGARVRVREGPYVHGAEAAPAELVHIDEMSDMFLAALGIPKVSVKTVRGDSVPLTFPTLMRAFVLHQEDSFGAILDKMIPEQRRTDIIGFLAGITPVERFAVEDQLAEVQREAQETENYFRSVQTFLQKNDVPTLIEASARVRNAEEALRAAVEAQRGIQEEMRRAVTRRSEQQAGRIESLRRQLLALNDEAAQIEHSFIGLEQEEERLSEVLASLSNDRRKAQRLHASSTILSSVEFTICPRCLLDITHEMSQREQHARCTLCNRPLRTTSDTPPRAAPRTEDIDLQIQETETVLKDVHKEVEESRRRLQTIRNSQASLSQVLDRESRSYVSPAVDLLLARAHEVAQREADLAKATSLYNQAVALESIREKLNELKGRQTELEDKLREARKPKRRRLNELRRIYEQILLGIDFPNFRECTIDSQSLMPTINGNLYIHMGAALRGLATVAYHLALLEIARTENTFFPKMLVIDSPAVGDLNDESHDKLLRYLAGLQFDASSQPDAPAGGEDLPDWQIILTTRRMVPELEPYVREKVSRPDRLLLRRQKRVR
jgi:hypothetical protein